MTKIKIQDPEGRIIEEVNIMLTDGDVLICQFIDANLFRRFIRHESHKDHVLTLLKQITESKVKYVVFPPGMTLKVLHKEVENG